MERSWSRLNLEGSGGVELGGSRVNKDFHTNANKTPWGLIGL